MVEVTTLESLLEAAGPPEVPGLVGRTEVAVYRGRRLSAGREVSTTVTMRLRPESLNREYYVPADWPPGQKPLVEVLALSGREAWVEEGTTHQRAWDLYRGDRPLKMSGVAVEEAGTVAWELQLWRERPLRIHLSHRDGEGSAQGSFVRTGQDFFEEELPLVLRQVDLRPRLTAVFRLFPPQADGAIGPLQPVRARLSVEETDGGWRVDVEAADGREIRYLFDREAPRALRSMEHSDGRSLERLSLNWSSGGGL